MYALYRLGSVHHDPDALWLLYEWGDSFTNSKWRPCVEHFVGEVANQGHTVKGMPSPPFVEGEDFVEVAYLVDGVKTVFSSDHLLSLIVIASEDSSVLRGVWNHIGTKVGWVD